CAASSTFARKLLGIPRGAPLPPGAAMPQDKSDRKRSSTGRPLQSSTYLSSAFARYNSAALLLPLPNSLVTFHNTFCASLKVRLTRGVASAYQGLKLSASADCGCKSSAARIAEASVVLPRSFGPYSTFKPGPNSSDARSTAWNDSTMSCPKRITRL